MFAKLTHQYQAINVEIVNNQYTKGGIRLTCGKGNFTRKLLSVIDWANFFNNPKNKKDLIKLVCSYFQTDQYTNLFEIPLIINIGENTYSITKEKIEVSLISNHEEDDTRFIFDTEMSNEAAVIVAQYIRMSLYT